MMAMSFEEVRAQEDEEQELDTPICIKCKQELRESVTGCRYTADGYVCSDCYFDLLSDILEKYPIRTARIRRG